MTPRLIQIRVSSAMTTFAEVSDSAETGATPGSPAWTTAVVSGVEGAVLDIGKDEAEV